MATQKIAKKSFFDQGATILSQNNQKIMFVFGVIILAVVLYCGRMVWITYQNRSAQAYFGALTTEYNQALNDKNVDWQSLQNKFEKGFNEHSRSPLLAYYKSYVVNILLQQNKTDEAVALLDTVIADSASSSMDLLYSLERALIDMDSADTEQQKKGEASLKSLANDTHNMCRDTAQFYLGRYYWSQNKIDEARAVWQQLVDEQAHEKAAPSPWAQQVEAYLKVMIV